MTVSDSKCNFWKRWSTEIVRHLSRQRKMHYELHTAERKRTIADLCDEERRPKPSGCQRTGREKGNQANG